MAKKKIVKRKTKKATKVAKSIKETKAEREERLNIKKVISAIVVVFIGIFLYLCLFGLCGTIGEIIKNIVISSFGTFGYAFPLLIVFSLVLFLMNNNFSASAKTYAAIIFYFSIICFFTNMIKGDMTYEEDLTLLIEQDIQLSKLGISFAKENFSAGLIATSVVYISQKAIGIAGTSTAFIAVAIISFILIFGLGLSKFLVGGIVSIFMFIPNIILNRRALSDEDREIALSNEQMLKNAINNTRKTKEKLVANGIGKDDDEITTSNFNNSANRFSNLTKYGYDDNSRIVPEKKEENAIIDDLEKEYYMADRNKHINNSALIIKTEDIQSRFYRVDNDKKDLNKENLLKKLQKNSINELTYQNKDLTADSFYYSDNMKPLSELSIDIPAPNINLMTVPDETKNNNDRVFIDRSNNDGENDRTTIGASDFYNNNIKTFGDNYNKNDSMNFARGLNDLQNENNDDIKNMSSEELLSSKKNIEIKNSLLRDGETNKNKTLNKKKIKPYKFPLVSFLNRSQKKQNVIDDTLTEKSKILVETLKTFGVGVNITNITVGPSITRFELKPDIGVKISKILSLEDDLKLALAATEIRIEAPIPGKAAIGVEIPNKNTTGVLLGDIISDATFKNAESYLTVAIGKDISGKSIVADLRKMPHLLIAGATGSGKSVCINSIIMSILYKARPEDVRLIMVDPKVVELQVYDNVPHLLIPVVTDARKASNALQWAVNEMMRRYNLIQERKVRDIESYNKAILKENNDIDNKIRSGELKLEEIEDIDAMKKTKLPYIVIIIDEFADLMMVASKEVENSIMRIAQLARACGIYLVIATQRPTVNVISGSIKTNVPSRISFAVSSGIDSQTVLDRRGAEKLLGHGDMLYFPQGIPEPIRLQGCYVSEEEILRVVEYIKGTGAEYDESCQKEVDKISNSIDDINSTSDGENRDDMFVESGRLIIEQDNASIGFLQRRLRMGFNRAARIIDELESEGVISKQDGKKPREILMTIDEFNDKFGG